MRYVVGFVFVLALGVMGCGETAGTGGGGGTAGSGGMAGDGGTGGDIAHLKIYTGEFDPDAPGLGIIGPLEGVEVCETETTNCVVSRANGSAELWLPVGQEFSLTVDKEMYTSTLGSGSMPADGSGSYVSFSPALETHYEARHRSVMAPYPMDGTGTILVQLYGSTVAGTTFDLVPAAGRVFYREEDKTWSVELTATTSHGGGGFVEVTPGEYQIDLGGAAENCVVSRGWLGDSENTIRVPVREGYVSTLRMNCD